MSDIDNPYRASEAALVDTTMLWDVESANKWRRFFNLIIDTMVIYGIFAVVGVIAVAFGFEQVLAWIEGISRIGDILLTAAVRFLYYTLFEGLFGFSIGKLITNTRVVDESGNRLPFGRVALRSLCRHIPFEPFSLLFSDDEIRRGWHDSLAKSYVVVRGTQSRPVAKPRASLSSQFADGPFGPASKPKPAAAEASLPG